MKSNKKLSLSPAGQERHAEMRGELQAAFARHHRNRKRQKFVMASGVACAAIVALIFLFSSIGGDDPNQQIANSGQFAGSEQKSTKLRHVAMEIISDEQLLDMLEEIGHPSILAKVNGKTVAIPCRQDILN